MRLLQYKLPDGHPKCIARATDNGEAGFEENMPCSPPPTLHQHVQESEGHGAAEEIVVAVTRRVVTVGTLRPLVGGSVLDTR